MSKFLFITMVVAGLCGPAAFAQSVDRDAQPPLHAPIDYTSINAEIAANMERLGLAAAPLESTQADRDSFDRLVYPVRPAPNADVFEAQFIGNYVDLDPASPNSRLDWACGARTYDLNSGYDHAGTDISAGPFPAHGMSQRWVEIVAAASGVIIARNDTAQDRNCGGIGADPSANYVSILQDDGLLAYYWHMARASLTDKQVGDRVEAGEFLGLVGSSGLSTAPHLHFELRQQDVNGSVVDPFAGTCGETETLWRHQHEYVDPAINGIFTHNFTPAVPGSFCQPEYPRFRTDFDPGNTVHLGIYVRDQGIGAASSVEVMDPEGMVAFSQTFDVATAFSALASYQTRYTLPDPAMPGQWTIRATFQGDVRERAFYVGGDPAAGARLAAAVLPGSRSFQSGNAATVFATVLNPSDVSASGCWIAPATPFAGRFTYRETDPVTNVITGDTNALFDIAPGSARSFVLSFSPHAGSSARSHDLLLRYKCINSEAAPFVSGVNSVLLSFGAQPVPDLIAIAVTPSGDGILRIADASSAAAFATAVANVGAAGNLTVRPAATGSATSMRLRICETAADTGACLAPASESISRIFASNETASFAVFGRAQGEAVPFAPATARIQLIAEDADGVVRGSTSVAVRTN